MFAPIPEEQGKDLTGTVVDPNGSSARGDDWGSNKELFGETRMSAVPIYEHLTGVAQILPYTLRGVWQSSVERKRTNFVNKGTGSWSINLDKIQDRKDVTLRVFLQIFWCYCLWSVLLISDDASEVLDKTSILAQISAMTPKHADQKQ
jgi:hypothetical protein